MQSVAFWGHHRIGKLLIAAGADVNARAKRQVTPLHSAARMANTKMIHLLLKHGAKIDARDDEGKTPLDWCCDANSQRAKKIKLIFDTYRRKRP